MIERAYRMDEFSEENWSSVAAAIPAPGQGPPPNSDRRRAQARNMMALRFEYLQDVLVTKGWYQLSVPVVTTDDDGVEVRKSEDRHFQVLNQTSTKSRPHLMPTIES